MLLPAEKLFGVLCDIEREVETLRSSARFTEPGLVA
jgi:hypothetical protein